MDSPVAVSKYGNILSWKKISCGISVSLAVADVNLVELEYCSLSFAKTKLGSFI